MFCFPIDTSMKSFITWLSNFLYLFPDWYIHETSFACNEELRHPRVKKPQNTWISFFSKLKKPQKTWILFLWSKKTQKTSFDFYKLKNSKNVNLTLGYRSSSLHAKEFSWMYQSGNEYKKFDNQVMNDFTDVSIGKQSIKIMKNIVF